MDARLNSTSVLSVTPAPCLMSKTTLPPSGLIAAATTRCEPSSEIASNALRTASPVASLIFETISGSR